MTASQKWIKRGLYERKKRASSAAPFFTKTRMDPKGLRAGTPSFGTFLGEQESTKVRKEE
ncbi:hypothetical protein A3762_10900 [Oleiphilus sp. HI0125]|nr:hypothetical protein A3762_10900 [Oleiphilus sp. HI0125]